VEAATFIEMTPVQDIRQSEKWGLYLKSWGWNYAKTSSGILIAYKNVKIGSVVKVQRPKNITQKDLDEIDKVCKENKALFVKMEPFYFEDTGLLEKNGYTANTNPLSPPSTFYIDLTKSEEDLWKNISESGHYSINRSRREETVMRFYQNPMVEKLEPYFKMCQETGRRNRFLIQPYHDLLAKVKVFGKDSHLILAYDKKGNLLSGKFYMCYKDMVLYSTGGTTALGRKGKAGYQLLWDSILYFKGLGYKVFDLEGRSDERFKEISRNWAGFTHFKERFGAEVIEFPYPYNKYFSSFLRVLDKIVKMPL
jgi:lipid II:glycine glycyltransferase (peptidoglycan interpeptide bridge formation enzyme)